MANGTAIKSRNLSCSQLLTALRAFRKGDFSVRLPVDLAGRDGEIADAFNDVVKLNEQVTKEIESLNHIVGKEGKIGHRAKLPGATGSWAANILLINELIGDMAQPNREMARVIGAVAEGDLSQTMTLDIEGRMLRGDFLRISKVVNTMVDQLNSFASEVTRVAREVGTEGRLGGQAKVRGVAGTWKDLTDKVNTMAANLTGQVRNIAEVTSAVAKGDLSKKVTVNVQGEILDLKNTVNTMVDQLNSFASEVTRVAREVGTEGKLGGQAKVGGVAGTWKDLTDNVNQLAENLTTQVRAIAEVSAAVTKGDLSRSITVNASGEVAGLKDNINQMIRNLVHSQKMEAVGQLTGGIAHDFSNLLMVILGNIDLLSLRLDGDERLRRRLSATRHAAERGRSLTQQLLAFSRRQHFATSEPRRDRVVASIRATDPPRGGCGRWA
jgi:HAMP domain-containing protein